MTAAGGWLLGVWLQLQQASLSEPRAYRLALMVGVIGLLVGLRPALAQTRWRNELSRHNLIVAALMAVCAMAAAWGWAGERATERLAQRLAPELVGQDIELTGRVIDLPRLRDRGSALLFEIESARRTSSADVVGDGLGVNDALNVPTQVPALISLSWHDDNVEPRAESGGAVLASHQTLPPVQPGQRWRLTARLKQVHASINPHGFDAELWWFERGVRAMGVVRVRHANAPQLLAEREGSPVPRWRQAWRRAIYERVGDAPVAGVVAALSMGDQAAIDRDDWTVFRRTGVAHLMSISGLHITMFAWLAQWLVRWGWARSTRLSLWWPAPHAALLGGVVLAWGYAVFAGWGIPAQRTVLMLAVASLLQLGGVRWPWPMILIVAAVAVVAVDPWACLQAGFWLSFMAVGLLMASGPAAGYGWSDRRSEKDARQASGWVLRTRAAVANGLRTQVVATLGLAPLTLIFFNQISLVGFAANVVAIPVVSFVITPLALAGGAWAPLWSAAAWVVRWLDAYLSWLSSVPWATWSAASAPAWANALCLAGAALLVIWRADTRLRLWGVRALALLLMLPLLLYSPTRPGVGRFELVAADVGQGTAVLVRTAHHLLIYDAGPLYGLRGEGGDAAGKVLLPLLHARGERAPDVLLLSHRDTDHVGGARTLMAELPPRQLLSSLEDDHPLRAYARKAGVQLATCTAGQRWVWDGVRFEVLHPDTAQSRADHASSNGRSCVLRVSGEAGSALLAGDIEREQEAQLVARLGDALHADVLVVPHHGSQTSSTEAWLDAVSPRVAVIQAGYLNRYGHPAPVVLERLRERHIEVVDSVACGAYSWWGVDRADACLRRRASRYWRAFQAEGGT